MGKYLSTFDTLSDYEAATSELGYPNVSLIKADGSILYAKNAPISSICYEIIPETIGSYTATTYDSVYSFADAKWYMLNNLNQYEEYGVYDFVEDIASATTYEGKLAVVDTTEYQYSGGSWNDVGTYEDVSVTYTIDDTQPSPYVGQEIPTTFKIPMSDVDAVEWLDLTINTAGAGNLAIGNNSYTYIGVGVYEGTVTNDGEYYYYTPPSEAPSSLVIDNVGYWGSTPIHLITSSKQISVEYLEKEIPIAKVYNTIADMEAVGCPTVGIGQYGVVSDDVYKFEETEEWVNKAKSSLKFVAKYNDNTANVVECNTSNELSNGETQPSYLLNNAMIDGYIGDCVTSIGNYAFQGCSGLTSIDIPSGITSIGDNAFENCRGFTSVDIPSSVTSIGDNAFKNCRSLTSVDIPSGVTSIGNGTFNQCRSLTSVDILSGVTSIGGGAFYYCSGLTSVTVRATTPPTLGTNVFLSTHNSLVIYVPSESVNAYKTATNWSTYASRIQAIP